MQPSGGSFSAGRYALADRKTVLMPAAALLTVVGIAIGIAVTVTRPTDSLQWTGRPRIWAALITREKATPCSADTSLQDCNPVIQRRRRTGARASKRRGGPAP